MNNDLRWWGWGTLDQAFPAPLAEKALQWLRDERGLPMREASIVPLDHIGLPEPRISAAAQQALLEGVELHASRLARVTHAYGKGYLDLLRLRRGHVSIAPDAVATPERPEQIVATLRAAEAHDLAVIPYGGGTSTNSSVECFGHAAISLDMRGLNRLVNIDLDAGLATFEAGILGPDLQAILQSYGCHLPHTPASFACSTLGGWIATRSIGSHAISAGPINDLVHDVQVLLPNGATTSTADELGQRLQSLWFGSNGTLGIMTQATVRIRPLPAFRLFRTALFPDWDSATQCLHDMLGRNARPTALELGDMEASRFDSLFDPPDTADFQRTRSRLLNWRYEERAIVPHAACRMVMTFEGDTDDLSVEVAQVERIVGKFGGVMAGKEAARGWYDLRLQQPYLRDDLLDQSLGMDTFHSSTSWTNLPAVYGTVMSTIQETLGTPAVVMARIPYAWREGATLSFTWIAPQSEEDEVARWRTVRSLAARAAANTGGTVDHHYAVPLDKEITAQLETAPLTEIQRALKRSLDVKGLLNPHKMGYEAFDLQQPARR
ncbi:MAG TPA: FAD-binding oxidoreductase [Candidatus Xenobia bacterium]|jgi:alkyldihydroxyacetonephosphate synthase